MPFGHTTDPWDDDGAAANRPPVEVRTSTRRRKYAAGFWQGDRIVVVLPARLGRNDREAMVESLVQRVLRHRPHVATSDEGLAARAAALGDRYLDGVRARSVRWSPHQRRRWGSCSLESRDVRISELLRPAPTWVLDAVLVHELAHLLEHGHGPRFRQLVGRYERTAEADAFLAGYALGLDQPVTGDRAATDPRPPDPVPGAGPGHHGDQVRPRTRHVAAANAEGRARGGSGPLTLF